MQPHRLQPRFRRLVRKFGGPRNKGRAETGDHRGRPHLLKIAYSSVLKTGMLYTDLYTRRESPMPGRTT